MGSQNKFCLSFLSDFDGIMGCGFSHQAGICMDPRTNGAVVYENMETSLPGFFAVGDGAGVTRGLAQAGASGVKAAQVILNRLK